MRFDFNTVADADLFTTVPEGVYVCRVAEVRETLARDGSPRWKLRLEVADGEYAGRTAAWDSITWSDRGVHRVQMVLCALGVDARGEVELEIDELMGRTARVRIEIEEFENASSGRRERRLRVPYAGFEALNGTESIDGEGGREESSDDASRAGSAATPF